MPSLIRKGGVRGWIALANTKVDQRVGSLISVLAPGTGPMPGKAPKGPRLNSNFDSETVEPKMLKMLAPENRRGGGAPVGSPAFSPSMLRVFGEPLFGLAT